jgi:hypothetical protein
MTDSSAIYSDDLREYFYSAPSDKVAVDTLEFRHPAFVDGDGNPVAVRVVNDSGADFVGTLEDGAPMNGGQPVTFVAAPFDITLPESNGPGLPSCQIAVDNVGRVLMDQIEAAVQLPHAVEVTYRQFLVDAPEEPGVVIDGMTLKNINVAALRITGTAGFEDDLNVPFGRKRYTPGEYPGLVR